MTRRRWWRLGVVGGVLAVVAGLWLWTPGCASAPDPWAGLPGEPRVVVTIPPLYSFVRAVAGKRAAIKCLCTTTGPHHYELDYRDARLLERGDLFFAIGLKLDNKFSDGLPGLAHRPGVPYVKMGDRLKDKGLVLKMRPHEHDKDAGEHAHVHGEYDPHVWMGMEQVVAMVNLIRDELIAVDPEHRDAYTKNAADYVQKLKKLHQDGLDMLKDVKVRRIVSFHDALEYFAKSFKLEIADVIEMAPGDHPGPGHLAELVELCRNPDKPIGAITVEPQYPISTSADQVRAELKGKGIRIDLVSIDPLETADPDELQKEGAAWYEKHMRSSLKALAGVLK
jgi:zinc transport system substrate-binding protein